MNSQNSEILRIHGDSTGKQKKLVGAGPGRCRKDWVSFVFSPAAPAPAQNTHDAPLVFLPLLFMFAIFGREFQV